MAKNSMTMTAQEISDKWNSRMKSAVSDMQRGVDRVTENPAEKAVAKQDKMLQNLTQAITNGKWAAGLRNVTLADWKNNTKNKIGSRLASGVDNAMQKRKKFDDYLVNTMNGAMSKVNSMPDMTFEDSVNRVRAVMEHMHNNPFKK